MDNIREGGRIHTQSPRDRSVHWIEATGQRYIQTIGLVCPVGAVGADANAFIETEQLCLKFQLFKAKLDTSILRGCTLSRSPEDLECLRIAHHKFLADGRLASVGRLAIDTRLLYTELRSR